MADMVEAVADALIDDHIQLLEENYQLRKRAESLQGLLQEYLDLNGDYAATMPSSNWVERVRQIVGPA